MFLGKGGWGGGKNWRRWELLNFFSYREFSADGKKSLAFCAGLCLNVVALLTRPQLQSERT